MTDEHVRAACRASAAGYTLLFGSVEDMHTLDRQRITQWATGIEGQVVDAGRGPGHWTNHLHQIGVKVQGVDLVPEFIDTARARFPDVSFRVASFPGQGGRLLIRFFEGIAAEPITHAVTTAYYWSVGAMRHMLRRSGFDVLDVETRQDPGRRPHAAISAIVR